MSKSIHFPPDSPLVPVDLFSLADAVQGDPPQLLLPSFQRDAVWDASRVELLWDSLLRGFPIGTILLARPDAGGQPLAVRRLQRSAAERAATAGTAGGESLIIIDGQQRIIAVALGLIPHRRGDSARLWLDLNPLNKPKEGELFHFHLCSVLRPWGNVPVESPAAKVAKNSLGEREEPLRDVALVARSWPVQAGCPVPFAALTAYIRLHPECVPQDVSALCPRKGKPDNKMFEQIKAAVLSLEGYRLPLHLSRNMASITDVQTSFNRLNSQALPLSQEELFYSGIKLLWPQCHDLVWEIHDDLETGKVLSQVAIVHLAVRLAFREPKADGDGVSDYPRLEDAVFRRLFEGKKRHKESVLQRLQQPLAVNKDVSRLHALLRQIKQLLVYDKTKGDDDIGLPLSLLPRISWRVWHTIAAWLYDRKGAVSDTDRLEMIRYAIADTLCFKSNATRAITVPFQKVSSISTHFPGREIFMAMEDRDLAQYLLSPKKYASMVRDLDGPVWGIFRSEEIILHWNQRHWMDSWFSGFDPSCFLNPLATPYDLDHILPQAAFNKRKINVQADPDFPEWRGPLAWSIGNKRYWPRGCNRGDHDNDLVEKSLAGKGKDPVPADSALRKWGLESIADVRAASVFDGHAAWGNLYSNEKGWMQEIVSRKVRKVIDDRRILLYTNLVKGLDWDTWLDGKDELHG